MRIQVAVAVFVGVVGSGVFSGGCASSGASTKAETRRPSAQVDPGPSAPEGIDGEKLQEIDVFFRHKTNTLQYRCYDAEVERTKKKYQGNVTVSLVVQPGHKVTDVKLTESSIDSKEIAECVMNEVKTWEWPEVSVSAPYIGSVNFKPAW